MGGGKLIGSDIDKDCVHSLCFITMLQTFCEGANNGGPSLAKFHEGPDPRTLAGSTPMIYSILYMYKGQNFLKHMYVIVIWLHIFVTCL